MRGKMVEADKGYRGEDAHIRLPYHYGTQAEKDMKAAARARHETCNRRFKQMGILKNRFCSLLDKHALAFVSIAVTVQIDIDTGNSLFPVRYG